MKKRSILPWKNGLALLGLGLFVLASCADYYDGDEKWSSSVTNAQLESPVVDSITVTKSTDGTKMDIDWSVVYGAGGYLVTLVDAANPDEPIVSDSLIDGCSITCPREDDVNYIFYITTMGNDKLNNTGATSPTVYTFTTFTPTYATIPAGTDLYQYFQENPIPADSVGVTLNYDLEAGGDYTLSDFLNFEEFTVTLRSTAKTNFANVTFTGENASFGGAAGVELKYLNMDASLGKGILTMSDSAVVEKTGTYFIVTEPYAINTCKVTGLQGYIFNDNGVGYCTKYVTVYNSVVEVIGASQMLFNCKGFIWNLTINKSTVYNSGENATNYMIRYQGRPKDMVKYVDDITQTVAITNSTLYNISKGTNIANYRQSGQATNVETLTSSIIVDCSRQNQFVRRLVGGQVNGQDTRTFSKNTYWFDGAASDEASYDTSGTILESDPAFVDAAGGDFTPQGADQIANATGDPRWLE